jgi:predicted nucleic acid-binding protein
MNAEESIHTIGAAVMGRQGDIKQTLEKILSYPSIEVAGFDSDDLIVGSSLISAHRVDFNDVVNLAIMERMGITEMYSNDEKYLDRLGFIRTIFE